MTTENIASGDKATTILLCGVGGQGTILAADILAKVAAASGLEVKISEIHGMAQRGGSVSTIVRFGHEVHTMVADPGSADCLVAFESTEAMRYITGLKVGGTLLVNDEAIPSLPVQIGKAEMPKDPVGTLSALGATFIPAGRIARDEKNPKGTNVVLIGALSASLPFSEEAWIDVITKRVPPKTIDANIASFKAGRAAASTK